MSNLFTDLPQIYTPASGRLTADGLPVTDIPQDASISLEAENGDFLATVPLLYGGAAYTYTPGTRNLTLSFKLVIESPLRAVIFAKQQLFHAKCLVGAPVTPTELIKFTFVSTNCELLESYGMPMMHQNHEHGKDRFNGEFKFIVHRGLDKLIINNVPSVIAP